jgi:hypothetical protein
MVDDLVVTPSGRHTDSDPDRNANGDAYTDSMHGEMFANTEATADCEGAAHSAASHNTGAASSFAAAYPVPAPLVVVLIC